MAVPGWSRVRRPAGSAVPRRPRMRWSIVVRRRVRRYVVARLVVRTLPDVPEDHGHVDGDHQPERAARRRPARASRQCERGRAEDRPDQPPRAQPEPRPQSTARGRRFTARTHRTITPHGNVLFDDDPHQCSTGRGGPGLLREDNRGLDPGLVRHRFWRVVDCWSVDIRLWTRLAMPLPVVVVAFRPGCQQTVSSAVIGSDGIGAAAGPGKARVHLDSRRVHRSFLWVGRDRRRHGAVVLRWGRRHESGSGGPVDGSTHSVLVSSAGSPDEATRYSLAVSSEAQWRRSPRRIVSLPEHGRTSPASKGGLAHKAGGHRERN